MKVYVRLGRRCVDAVTYSPAHNSMTHTCVELTDSALPYVSRLRDVIFDTPGLIPSEYDSVTILTDTAVRQLLPVSVDDPQLQSCLLAESQPAGTVGATTRVIDTPLRGVEARMVSALDEEFVQFLERTYVSPVIMPGLVPLIEYFAGKSRLSPDMQCYVNLRDDADGGVDIVVMRGDMPRLANTYNTACDSDVLYYIMSACEVTGFDLTADSNDVINLCGNRERRERLMPMLRERHRRVMPVIFPPSIYRAGRDALAVPYDIIAASVL